MSRSTFELLRIPAALVLLVIAVVVLWPRGGDAARSASDRETASPTVIAGEPGGAVVTPSPDPASASPLPTLTPASTATPEPTPAPVTPTPVPVPDTFSAEVVACRSLSGSDCDGRIERIPRDLATFTALVRFTDARAGDVINVVLSGPGGSAPGGAYTLQGGGNGYYYSTFQARSLPSGEYTLTATRNGEVVATTELVKRRG